MSRAFAASMLGVGVFAPAALAQLPTYSWSSPTSANWSVAGNWVGGAPPNAGAPGALLRFRSNAMAPVTATNNLPGVPYAVTQVLLDNVNLAGRALRVQAPGAAGASIGFVPTTQATISNNIELDTDQTTLYSSNDPAGPAPVRMTLSGAISERAVQAGVTSRRRLAFEMDRPSHQVLLRGNNTFTGNSILRTGVVLLGSNTALGQPDPTDNALATGGIIVEGANGTIAAWDGVAANPNNGLREVVARNHIFLGNDVKMGIDPENQGRRASLTFTGPLRVGRNNPQPGGGIPPVTRTISLAGGSNHMTEFAGDIRLHGADTLEFAGDSAPALNAKGKLPANAVAKRLSAGSRVVLSGQATSFNGELVISSATAEINGQLGAPNSRVEKSIQVGKNLGLNPGALIGRNTGTAQNPAINVFFAGNIGPRKFIDVGINSVFQPGASPGMFGIDGGDVRFDAGSSFGIDIDGTEAGNGNGFHSQLYIVDGGVDIAAGAKLGVDVTAMFSSIAIGSELTIINLATSSQRVTGYFSNPLTGQLLNSGSSFSTDGVTFGVDYSGGDGNDLVLTVLAVPSPGPAAAWGLALMIAGRRRRA